VVQSFGQELHIQLSIASVWVTQRMRGHLAQVVLSERDELKDAAAADQGAVDGEPGVLGGGANHDDRAVLYPGEQGVLLGLVPAMHLIDKEDGAAAIEGALFLRLRRDLTQFLDPGQHGIDAHEPRAGGVGNDHSQRRLARARRPVEDDRGELVRLDGAPQQAPWTEDVPLAHELVQGARPHSRGQRRFAIDLFLSCVSKKILLRHSPSTSGAPAFGAAGLVLEPFTWLGRLWRLSAALTRCHSLCTTLAPP